MIIDDVQKYYSRLGGLLFEWKRRKGEITKSNSDHFNDILKNELIKLQEEIDEHLVIGTIWGLESGIKKEIKEYKYKPLTSESNNNSTLHPQYRVPKKRGRKKDPELLILKALLHKNTKKILTNKKSLSILSALRMASQSDDEIKNRSWADSTLRRYYYEIDAKIK